MKKTLWDVIDSGKGSAIENMALDAELLASLHERTKPILHLYEWEGDAATYGYFIDPETYLHPEIVEKKKLNLARRSTGGGIVFHIWDLAFSVLVPASSPHFSKNTLDNYAFVNEAVLEAASLWTHRKSLELIPDDAHALSTSCRSFCMALPTKYDVMLEGRKIAGAAQRKTLGGFLHQGTIALTMPDFGYLEEILKDGERIIDGMRQYIYPLLGSSSTPQEVTRARGELKQGLITHLTKR